MPAGWTASGAGISGSTGRPSGATRPAFGGDATTSTGASDDSEPVLVGLLAGDTLTDRTIRDAEDAGDKSRAGLVRGTRDRGPGGHAVEAVKAARPDVQLGDATCR